MLTLLALISCAESRPEEKRYLVDQYKWVNEEVPSDYFGERPEELVCDTELGTLAEDLGGELVYSVYTQYCSWVTVTQPALSSIAEGEEFYLRFWHSTLTAPMGSKAHVVVTIDGDLIWDNEFPIPYPSGLDVVTLLAPKDYPEGAQILYHVDNHGNNEYSLVELSIRPASN
ncbi:MAG: hypothetical protein HOK97_22080 [Deltaproteobacteria bacterium]|nr:hypothetical protein [Deltaproteobacteria bacterium]MBT6492475.1 hypothetical protein [Deltaproteobacteria bacterium]